MTTIRRPKGSGGIRNRGTARHPRYQAFFKSEAAGEQLWVSKGGFARKADAEAWLAERLVEEREGRTVAPSKMTVGEMLDAWLEVKRSTWSVSYWEAETSRVESRIKPMIGQRALNDLRELDIDRLFAALRAEADGQPTSGKGRRPLSGTSLQHVYDTLNRSMKWAEKRRLVSRNVVAGHDRPRRDTDEMKVYTAEQLAVLVDELRAERRGPFFHLAAFTGMRRSELMRLRWQNVDLSAPSLFVHKAKTKRGIRPVDLDAGTASALRQWRKMQAADRLAWGPAYAQSELVFTNEDGSAFTIGQVRSTWERIQRRSSLPTIRLHDLRHTHASLLLAANTPVPLVAARLGDKPETILATYAHAIPGQGKAMADAFAAVVDGGRRGV